MACNVCTNGFVYINGKKYICPECNGAVDDTTINSYNTQEENTI